MRQKVMEALQAAEAAAAALKVCCSAFLGRGITVSIAMATCTLAVDLLGYQAAQLIEACIYKATHRDGCVCAC
jgi:sulfur relay (sulfurtransferase) complex TusBCD TusD component (DsrE family)